MGDHPRATGFPLHLLADRTAYEALQKLAESSRGSTLDQIGRSARKRTLRLLRALAIEGLVGRCGTWDTAPTRTTLFTLTARGYQMVAHLNVLAEWAEDRAREQHRPPSRRPREHR